MPYKPFSNICVRCNNEFFVPRKQKHCSYKCAALSEDGRLVRSKNIQKINANPLLMQKRVMALRKIISGSNHWKWKGGISIGANSQDYRTTIEEKRRAKKRANGGSFTVQEWIYLKQLCLNRCVCCRRPEPEIKLTVDHILPISLGGTSFIENIQPLCKSCNSIKRQINIQFKGLSRQAYEKYIKTKKIIPRF